MIKVISAARRHPTHRPLAEFHRYWAERHGPLFARTPELRAYVQHHTLPEAYAGEPMPTHDGASMFWYDDLEALRHPLASPVLSSVFSPADGDLYDWYVASARYGSPDALTLREAVGADDRQLFDRSPDWPLDDKRTSVVAEERVIVDGKTSPEMVKAIYTAARRPGLSLAEFSKHWFEVHGALGAKAPGLRRYVQNHAPPEAYAVRGLTHDGFSELWFDDLASLRASLKSPEWQALREDGQSLFAQPMSVVVARERVIKAL
jgi:uncharacterized protein (TIGR02118 family)